jgi:hypothetical protein
MDCSLVYYKGYKGCRDGGLWEGMHLHALSGVPPSRNLHMCIGKLQCLLFKIKDHNYDIQLQINTEFGIVKLPGFAVSGGTLRC